MCSNPGFSNVEVLVDSTGNILTPQTLMIEYLKTANLTSVENKVIDTSSTNQWPQTEFVQPLQGVIAIE